jgi:hypothetical protein
VVCRATWLASEIIAVIIHHAKRAYYFASQQRSHPRYAGKSADQTTNLPTGHGLHVKSRVVALAFQSRISINMKVDVVEKFDSR